jgi:peptide/nickel transport system substrate-binding protein
MFTRTVSVQGAASSVFNKGNLVRPARDNTFAVGASLATDWSMSEDGKTWTFNVRKGVKWHDGTPLVASDFVYWINLHTAPPEGRRRSTAAFYFGDLKEATAPDDHTVVLHMNTGQPNLLESLSTDSLMMAHPPHLVQPHLDAGNFKVQPNETDWVALGPFTYKIYKQGSLFQVRRFDDYWEKDSEGRALPYLDGIDFVIIRDRGVTVNAFRAGRLDSTSRGAGFFLVASEVEAIQRDFGDKAYFTINPYSSWGVNFNSQKPPFDDIRLRKAMNLWVDRQEALEALYGGFGFTQGIFYVGSDFTNPDFLEWPGINAATKEADKAEALALLKEAGLEKVSVTMLCRDNYIEMCEFHDGQFRNMGIDSNIAVVDTNLLQESTFQGNFEYNLGSAGAVYPSDLRTRFHSENPYAQVQHGDPELDAMIEKIDASWDQAERIQMSKDVERYMLQEKHYAVSSFVIPSIVAFRDYFKGYQVPTFYHNHNTDYAFAWLDK